ncbi:hypothetical protein ACXWR7_13965, partial [Streptococcus pyogenes]
VKMISKYICYSSSSLFPLPSSFPFFFPPLSFLLLSFLFFSLPSSPSLFPLSFFFPPPPSLSSFSPFSLSLFPSFFL